MYLVGVAPGELVCCLNTREAMNAKLYKYDMASEGYITQTGTLSVPCPPIFFDTNTEQGYIADIKENVIFAGIEPLFLIQKFVNML
jgi:hypothetical protein